MSIRTIVAVLMLVASFTLLWFVFFGQNQVPEMTTSHESDDPYPQRNWNETSQNPLNISLYTFRDSDRNGEYNPVDFPMSSIRVEMVDANEDIQSTLSNTNGYANFKMNFNNPEQPIFKAGVDHRFRVVPPPGWMITSGNREQVIRFRHLPGSVSGLVAETPPQWVGLAPELNIHVAITSADSETIPDSFVLQVTDPGGKSQTIKPGPDGLVSIDASPGVWRLVADLQDSSWHYEQTVKVENVPVVLMPIKIGEEKPQALPHITTENFDWLDRSVLEKIPNKHLTLNWDYLIAVDNQYYGGPGYANGLNSGHAVAYNSSGHPVTISAPAGEKFDFVGGYFSVAWPKAHGETLEITAWRNGSIVSQSALPLSYLGPVWLEADLRQIDRLVLSSRHYWQFVTDDMKFRLRNPVDK